MIGFYKFLKTLTNWIIAVVLIFIVWFGISNPEMVTISLFPFAHARTWPFSVIVLGVFLLGAIVMWLRAIAGRLYTLKKQRLTIEKKAKKEIQTDNGEKKEKKKDDTETQPPHADW